MSNRGWRIRASDGDMVFGSDICVSKNSAEFRHCLRCSITDFQRSHNAHALNCSEITSTIEVVKRVMLSTMSVSQWLGMHEKYCQKLIRHRRQAVLCDGRGVAHVSLKLRHFLRPLHLDLEGVYGP